MSATKRRHDRRDDPSSERAAHRFDTLANMSPPSPRAIPRRVATVVVLVLLLALPSCAPPAPPPEPPMTPLEIPPLPPSAAVAPKSREEATRPPEKTEPPMNDPAAAEALFQKGREAASHGDLATARDRFEESYRLDPATGTALNLADVEARLGDNASARRHFQEAYDHAMAAGQSDRASFARARMNALPP